MAPGAEKHRVGTCGYCLIAWEWIGRFLCLPPSAVPAVEQDSEEAGERVCGPALVGGCFPKWGVPWRSLQHFLPVFLPRHLLKTPEGQVRPQSYSLQRTQPANVFISLLSFCRAKKQLIPGGGGGDWSMGLCQWAGSRECRI